MVIKIRKKIDPSGHPIYKSTKTLVTQEDIKIADDLDAELEKKIKQLEKTLINTDKLSSGGEKINALKVWYEVGKTLNKLLQKFVINNEDDAEFWKNLYNYFLKIHHGKPLSKVSKTRNDFITATKLAKHPWKTIRKIDKWAIWREVLSYKNITEDKRILEWVIYEFSKNPGTRDEARVLLKAIAKKFKKIYTPILNDTELNTKLQNLKNQAINNH